MDIFSLFIISLVEGITEFLPISSTGHMIIVGEWLGLEQSDKFKALEVMIQFFAILAILFIYKDKVNINQKTLWYKTFIAFLPVAVIGLFFSDFIKSLFSIQTVAIMFVLGGIALLFSEKIYNKNKKQVDRVEDITHTDALKIGLFQVLSLIPGTSRSASTIFGGMFLGINRKIAAEFSFLLAVPVTFAVFSHDLVKYYDIFTLQDFWLITFASAVSFISAYVSVKFFITYLEKFSLAVFGWYRIIFGIILLFFFI